MDDLDEVDRLQALVEACNRVLAGLDDRDDEIATAIRETCRLIEARLASHRARGESPS